MICSRCQQSNRPQAIYCRHCGALFARTCSRCRTTLPPDAHFCDQCGHSLAGSEQPAQPANGKKNGTETGDEPAQSKGASLQRYIPQELLQKLEAARAGGEMVGERRVVTMLFCDVRGSTQAASQLDPEEWTEIINGAFQEMIQPVYQYEGTVARLMGDAILAFFGAPIGHEDDPQRAVLAGLDIVEGIQDYRQAIKGRYGVDINVRVGINTGMVVVGAVGSDLRMEYTAMGDAINLASRMEQTAQPGTVQIAAETYGLVAPLFDVEKLGLLEVKGREEPVQAYRVLGLKSQPGRLRGVQGLNSPMVGRDQELAQAVEAMHKARQGEGQIIAVIGEAGLGKSRLLKELRAHWEQAAGAPGPQGGWKETAALSYQAGRPYETFYQQSRQTAGIAPNDDPATIQEKLSRLSQGRVLPPEVVSLQEILLGAHQNAPLDGEAFRRELYTAMEALARFDTAEQPVAYVADDLHWADSASLDLQAHSMQILPELPMLVVLAFRPDREAPIWRLREDLRTQYPERYTEIVLRPLSREDGSRLVDQLLAMADLPAALRQRILDRADGNPFFLEEILRSLMEQGVLVRNQNQTRWQAVGAPEQIQLPTSLQSLLNARIDRLEERVRHTLQLAAVIGRSFYQRVLAAIDEESHQLDQRLADLERSNIIVETAQLPEHEFMFRHTMTQEAAYNTLLLRRRRDFHRQVGETLERLFPNRRQEMAPSLAHHFAQAGEAAKAFAYFTQAGQSAFNLYALEEAVRYFRSGLEWAEAAADGDLARLYTQLGRALELLHRYPEAMTVYLEMVEAGRERSSATLHLGGLIGQATALTVSELYDPQQALSLIEEGLALAEEAGTPTEQAKALWTMMLVQMYGFNHVVTALDYGERSLAMARTHGLTEQVAFVLSDLAIACGQVGYHDQMTAYLDEAIVLWQELGNKPMSASTHHYMAIVAQVQGRYAQAIEHAEIGNELGLEVDNIYAQAGCLGVIGWASKEMGELGRSIEVLEKRHEVYARAQGMAWDARMVELGLLFADLGMPPELLARFHDYKGLAEQLPPLYRPWILSCFAYLEVQMEDFERAQATLDRVYHEMDEDSFNNGAWATYHLACGRLALAHQDPQSADEQFQTGIAWCQHYQIQGTQIELLYYRSLALLQLGQENDARQSLEEAYHMAASSQVRWRLWQIAAQLAFLTHEGARRDQLLNQAQDLLDFIQKNAGSTEIRQAVERLPLAQKVRQQVQARPLG